MEDFQPTEYYVCGDSHVVVLMRFGNGMNAAIEYSERHKISAVQALPDKTLAKYYELVNEEPWFWQECIACIRKC
jgi:hypothetical protein